MRYKPLQRECLITQKQAALLPNKAWRAEYYLVANTSPKLRSSSIAASEVSRAAILGRTLLMISCSLGMSRL